MTIQEEAAGYRHAKDMWFYPDEIKKDLSGHPGLSSEAIMETLACAWEYTRCVIPHFTNRARYIAFSRIIIIGIIAECHGELIDIVAGDMVLGYNLNELFDIIFGGTTIRDDMAREYRAFLLFTAEKSSDRKNSELFRRYANVLARSPGTWFRLRDCDALARFTMAAALCCNDMDKTWFSENELRIMTEVADTLYDAVAFYKHRAEGETNSTFAYASQSLRTEAYRRCREILWAMDVVWADSPAHRCVVNFIRLFGGPIHMMMRRYRYVEDNLVIGKVETDEVVAETRHHYKLWNRIDVTKQPVPGHCRLQEAMRQKDRLLFTGLAEILQDVEDGCGHCQYKVSYGAEGIGQFGGVELCSKCKAHWSRHLESLPERAAKVFPRLAQILHQRG